MIKKDQAQEILKQDKIATSRRTHKKVNDWVSGIIKIALSTPMEEPASMETPPSMDTPPWKGLHGDV